ncbi:MAG TPA: hypothetical protein VLA05_04605 [Coriobacteriia bacterium]|nr:hypothetical protein [Coriobacteriia bacterium]
MRFRHLFAWFVALIFCVLLASPPDVHAGTISGTATDKDGAPAHVLWVEWYHDSGNGWQYEGRVSPLSDGRFDTPELAAGAYRLRFANWAGGEYREVFWGGTESVDSGSDLSVPEVGTVAADVTLQSLPRIVGNVRGMPEGVDLTHFDVLLQKLGAAGWGQIQVPPIDTSASGSFSIPLAPGDYRFGVRKDRNYGPLWLPDSEDQEGAHTYSLEWDQEVDLGTVSLWRDTLVTGYTKWGEYGVLGVPSVEFYRKNDEGAWILDTSPWTSMQSGWTSDFQFSSDASGTYRIVSRSNDDRYYDCGYPNGTDLASASDLVLERGRSYTLNVVHRPIVGSLHGLVTLDSAGTPAPGRKVTLSVLASGASFSPLDAYIPSINVATATTDAAGRFAFEDLEPASTRIVNYVFENRGYWIKVEDPQGTYTPRILGLSVDSRINVLPGARADVSLQTVKAARITGTVKEASTGKLISGTSVTLKNAFSKQVVTAAVEDGTFDSGALSPVPTLEQTTGDAVYDLQFVDPTNQWVVVSVSDAHPEVSPGESKAVTITVKRLYYPDLRMDPIPPQVEGVPFSLTGSLYTAAAAPISGKSLAVYRSADGSPWTMIGTTVVDSLGHWRLDNVLPAMNATYEVRFAGDKVYPKMQAASRTLTEMTFSAPKTSEYGSAVVSGYLTDATGKSLSNKPVAISAADASGEWRVVGEVSTDANGRYSRTMAPKQRTSYRAYFSGEADYMAQQQGGASVLPKARLTRTTAWSELRLNRTYNAKGYTEPYHSTTDSNKVMIRAYKKNRAGDYVYVKSFKASYVYYSKSKTAYNAPIKFTSSSSKGSWKFVAYHASDSANYKTYGSADYVKVR